MNAMFHMSEDEDFGEACDHVDVVASAGADNLVQACNNEETKSNLSLAPQVKTPEMKNRVRRRDRPPSFSTCFTDYYSFTEEVLGMGAQGVVCTCVHKTTGVEYAVKLINKQLHPDRQRVFKEMDIFYTCRNCDYILKLHEYFEDETYFYLIFDKMYGGQLLHHILKRGHLNEREASMVTRQIAEALQFMHRKGLAHRDLKPENILCQNKSELLPIKICDFDLASALRHAGISTMTTPALSTPVGSAEFMAPEVVDAWVLERDKGELVNYDKRCDLWSLGVIIYIMLCGYPPFYGRCDNEDCGWDEGKYCRECQYLLFCRIQDGEFCFPSPEWDYISNDAKDLISNLLVCDARLRYSAEQILQHRWIRYPAPKTALGTASVLQRDNSVRNLENFTNEALSITKLIDDRLVHNTTHPSSSSTSNDPPPPRRLKPGERAVTFDATTTDSAGRMLDQSADRPPSSKMFATVDGCADWDHHVENALIESVRCLIMDQRKRSCGGGGSRRQQTGFPPSINQFSSGGSSCGAEYRKKIGEKPPPVDDDFYKDGLVVGHHPRHQAAVNHQTDSFMVDAFRRRKGIVSIDRSS